jgi:hypothetical protein
LLVADNINVFAIQMQNAGISTGPMTAIVYAPELGLWIAQINSLSSPQYVNAVTNNIFTQWSLMGNSFPASTLATQFYWSSTQAVFFATLSTSSNNCFYSSTG